MSDDRTLIPGTVDWEADRADRAEAERDALRSRLQMLVAALAPVVNEKRIYHSTRADDLILIGITFDEHEALLGAAVAVHACNDAALNKGGGDG